MSEFTPITTQEEFDAAIKDRLERERRKYADHDGLKGKIAEYEGQISTYAAQLEEANKKAAGFEQTVSELNAKIRSHELASTRTRIALETGLPYEMASRLTGESDDEIKADAQSLVRLIGNRHPPAAPLASSEPSGVDNTDDAALRSLLANLKEE